MGPTLYLHEKLNALQLTALDVRCTWDGGFLRHVCHHSHVLDTLTLRDYSACVFDGAAPACLPSLTSLVLEFRDAALAEGLINLALFLDLPNLGRLAVKGSGTPGVGHPLRHWQGLRPFPSLLTLRLENTVFQRPLDAAILGTLSANVTELQLRNVHRGPLNDAEILSGYANLAVIEIARGTQVRLPAPLRNMVSVRHISAQMDQSACAELDFYVQSDGSVVDFEREPSVHACSDFCELHNQSPWRDRRSDFERHLDRLSVNREMIRLDRGPISVL
jgi:hypothetical protein